jgi:hypothetical protein
LRVSQRAAAPAFARAAPLVQSAGSHVLSTPRPATTGRRCGGT